MSASDPKPLGLPDEIRTLLERALADGVCPAAALGVVRADGRRHRLALGHLYSHRRVAGSLRASPAPAVRLDTAWDLASLTKPMAVVTLICRELARSHPRLTLGSLLADLLPDSRGTPLADASVARLLGHASGALAWADWFDQTLALHGQVSERAAAVRRLVLATPLAAEPGTRAVYSDVGFMALGWALEAVCGAPLDVLFEREVTRPLALQGAGYRRPSAALSGSQDAICATEIWPPRCEDGLALQGVVHDDNCAALDGVAGHAGLFAPLDDVLSWAAAWLNATTDGGEQAGFLQPSVACELVRLSAAPETTWRLGWDTPSTGASSAGVTVSPSAYGHLGYTGTSVWIDPDLRAAAVLLTNRVHPSREPHQPIKQLRPAIHDAVWSWLRQGQS